MRVFFVQTSVGLQTKVYGPMRCGACVPMLLFVQPRSVLQVHAPKRRFWKELQKMRCVFSTMLFSAGVSARFGLRTIEKSIENPHFIFCFVFQNLRLGSTKLQTDAYDMMRC